ncbi:MAG: diguanylate cyclase [Gammaproteobacteria bacterium]
MTDSLDVRDTQSIYETLPVPALVLDSHSKIISHNRAFTAMVGEQAVADLQGKNAKIMADHPLRSLLESTDTVSWQTPKGEELQLRVQCVALENTESAGELRLYFNERELLDLKVLNHQLDEKLQQNILTDAHTGLLNQRGTVLALEPQVARSRRYNRPLAVVALAVAGSVSGRELMLAVGHLLKDQLRWADLIGVTDKQQFVIALPETDEQSALQLVDKITQLLKELSNDEFNGEPLVAAFGISDWQKNDNATSLIERALQEITVNGKSESTATSAL